jgi:hypothetical protein
MIGVTLRIHPAFLFLCKPPRRPVVIARCPAFLCASRGHRYKGAAEALVQAVKHGHHCVAMPTLTSIWSNSAPCTKLAGQRNVDLYQIALLIRATVAV